MFFAAWPPGLPLTIAAIADLHAGEPHVSLGRVEAVVAAANALRPDLIVLLGDYAASHRFVTRAVPPDCAAWLESGRKAFDPKSS